MKQCDVLMILQERLNCDVSVVNYIIDSKKSIRIVPNRNKTRRGIGDTKLGFGFVLYKEGKAEEFKQKRNTKVMQIQNNKLAPVT
jgi:hypothetical protein